jgi:hypothetical protein
MSSTRSWTAATTMEPASSHGPSQQTVSLPLVSLHPKTAVDLRPCSLTSPHTSLHRKLLRTRRRQGGNPGRPVRDLGQERPSRGAVVHHGAVPVVQVDLLSRAQRLRRRQGLREEPRRERPAVVRTGLHQPPGPRLRGRPEGLHPHCHRPRAVSHPKCFP